MNHESLAKINEALNKLSEDTLIFSCSPNSQLVAEALSFDVSRLGLIASEMLSKYTIVLSQYSIFMQSKYNESHVKYLNARKLYDFNLWKHIVDNKVAAKTAGEKENVALTGSEYLMTLKHEVDQYEAERDLLQDMDKALKLLIESLKKEIGRRFDEQNMSRGRSV